MKRFLLFGLVLALLMGYALMAAGSDDTTSSSSSGTTTVNTEEQQKNDETTKTAEKATESAEKATESVTAEQVWTSVEAPEYVKRASVTAMTNWCAFDGKVHSYSDTSGERCLYYMFVSSWGSWTQSDANTYQVKDLQLRTYGNEDGPTGEYDWESVAYKFTLDVKYDPAKNVYTISNVYSSYKEKGDAKYTSMEFCASHDSFTVSIGLIEKDRA